MTMFKFKVGDIVLCINTELLYGNEIKPPLIKNYEYTIYDIWTDVMGHQHLNVGLKSDHNFIRSWHTKEEIPNGDVIHWCLASRFRLKDLNFYL